MARAGRSGAGLGIVSRVSVYVCGGGGGWVVNISRISL